jgi:hypothetical protein
VRAAEPERLLLPAFIKRELGRLKKANLWDGDPDDPNLDPAVVLTQLMVDERLLPELRAVCAKTLLPYYHEDRALMLKAEQGPETERLFVIIRQFGSPEEIERIAAKRNNTDYNEPSTVALRDRSVTPPVPTPATPAAITSTRAPGAEVFQMRVGDDGIARPVRDEARVSTGYYQTHRDADGVERLREVEQPPRQYHGEPDGPVVIVKTFKDFDA